MLWIIPAWAISLVAVYFFGYYMRGLVKKIEHLEEVVKSKVDKKPLPEEPKSIVIDVDDPVQNALWEHEQLQRRLNPDE